MSTPQSFHASAVDGPQLSAIMHEYLALEQARVYRRLIVTRFGLLALATGIAGVGFHWLPPFASWFGVVVFLVAPLWAWIVELRCDRRLSRHLGEVTGDTQHSQGLRVKKSS